MEYFVITAKMYLYSNIYTERKSINKNDFIKFWTQQSACGPIIGVYGCVSTTIKRQMISPTKISRRKRNIVIMALDCDSRESAIAAAKCLKRNNIKWISIESSSLTKTKYWLITDYIAPFHQVYDMMATIVGVDEKYLELCKNQKTCCLRAYPDINRIPNFDNINTEDIKNPTILQWIEEFKQLYEDLGPAFENIYLTNALKNKLKGIIVLFSSALDPNLRS